MKVRIESVIGKVEINDLVHKSIRPTSDRTELSTIGEYGYIVRSYANSRFAIYFDSEMHNFGPDTAITITNINALMPKNLRKNTAKLFVGTIWAFIMTQIGKEEDWNNLNDNAVAGIRG